MGSSRGTGHGHRSWAQVVGSGHGLSFGYRSIPRPVRTGRTRSVSPGAAVPDPREASSIRAYLSREIVSPVAAAALAQKGFVCVKGEVARIHRTDVCFWVGCDSRGMKFAVLRHLVENARPGPHNWGSQCRICCSLRVIKGSTGYPSAVETLANQSRQTEQIRYK